MREILFRGKNIFGAWVYGSYVHQTQFYGTAVDRHWILYDGEFDCDYYGADPIKFDTLSQFTGKYDIDGNRIFEGDIVSAKMDYGPGGYLDGVVPIEFRYGSGGYEWQYFDMSTIKVIGNKWDNPELLKGE